MYTTFKNIKCIYFLCRCLSANLLTDTVLHCYGNIPAEDNEEITSLTFCGMHLACSLQSPHSKEIGMITSILKLLREPYISIRVTLHP